MARVSTVLLGLWMIPLWLTAGPVVHIVAVDRIASENPSLPEWGIETPQRPSRKAAFYVWCSGFVWRPLTVNYKIAGSASNGVDYTALSGQVTIPTGGRSARIIIHPMDDGEVERRTVGSSRLESETVLITLQPSSAYRLSSLRQAKVFIVDDDDYYFPCCGGFIDISIFPRRPPARPGNGGSIEQVGRPYPIDGTYPGHYMRMIGDLDPRLARDPRDLRQ
jgi:hypothetical protein